MDNLVTLKQDLQIKIKDLTSKLVSSDKETVEIKADHETQIRQKEKELKEFEQKLIECEK